MTITTYIQSAMRSAIPEPRPKESRDAQIAMKVPSDFKRLLEIAAKELNVSQVEIVLFAVRDYARRKGIRPAATDTGRNATEAG